MSFGINVKNSSGNIILDSDLPQIPLIYSGTGGSGNVTITHPQTIQYPYIFLRPSNTGSYFFSGFVNSTNFTYFCQSGNMEYRVYDGKGFFSAISSGYGMQIWNSSGNVLYNTQSNPPFIVDIKTALFATDPYPDEAPTGITFLRSLTTSVTSYDGGRPFVSAPTLSLADIVNGSAWQQFLTLAGRWASSSQLDIYFYTITGGGSNPLTASGHKTGQWPRTMLFIK